MTTSKFLFAGFGGQGILFAGHLLAAAALRQGQNVSWVPSYGPEMRGGTAYCSVIVSPREISSPLVNSPDFLIAFNQPSLDKFTPTVSTGGTILTNSSLVKPASTLKGITQYQLPATFLAEQLGNDKTANVVMLGGLLKLSGVVTPGSVISELEKVFKDNADLVSLNNQALLMGYEKMPLLK